MLGEQARQVPRTDSQLFSQPLHAAVVELSFLDEGERTFDCGPGAFPCRAERR